MTALKQAMHYRWKDLPEDQPMDGLTRRRIIGEKAMLSEVHLYRGCHVPTHAHDNEQFAFVVYGEVRFGIGEEGSRDRHEITLVGGEVLHLPSHVPHSADAVDDSLVIDVFSPPSERTGIDRD